METLMWRASNVVISYGAIRGEGAASVTQEKEKKSSSKGGSFEKARLGEKSSAAAAAAATTSGYNGRGFALAPLPFPSAKNLVPAPLRFLWFPESKSGKGGEDASDVGSGVGKGGQVKIREIGDYLEGNGEMDGIRLGEGVGGGFKQRDVKELRPDLGEDSGPRDGSDASETEGGSGDELSRVEDGKVGKRWYQNILTGGFLKKGPGIEVRIPSTIILDSTGESLSSSSGGQISEAEFENGVEDLEEGVGASKGATCARGDAEKCVGCAAESENYVAESPPSSPLAALEVPHVNVTHNLESFSKFLSEVPLTEMKIIAQTSFLSNLAYVIPEIKAGDLARYHRMLFVTSSIDIKAEALAKEKAETLAQEKAAAAAKTELERKEPAKSGAKQPSYLSPETAYALASAAASFLRSQKKGALTPTSEEEKEAAAASNDDDNDEKNDDEKNDDAKNDDEKNKTESELGRSVSDRMTADNSLDSASIASFMGELDDSQQHGSGLPSDLSTQDMPAFMRPVTSVVSAENETKQEVADNLRSLHTCPCEWFTCDEKGGPTRFFSIQGSESFSSWQANLLFEPIQFEGPDLGVMVHRGIYEAAIGLYDQILPYVLEHQRRYGEHAKFRFTGHSLGGSLAMLLTLMLNIRGVVKNSNLLPVYTFGAPYIMCGGDYLLEKLGLPPTHVQYIVMHRDIVPRTFACNYPDHIAEVLRRVNGIFRDHTCLTRQRLLYAPMGQLMVLQPDPRQNSQHPLLPSGSGLYLIRHQSHNEPPVSTDGGDVAPSRAVQVRAAQRAFLNQPHPLEIISDPGSYGSEGSIAKHHDPRNYSKAINSVLRQEMRRWRRLQRERRRQLWWPLVSADGGSAVSKGASLGVQERRGGAAKGVTGQGMCGPSGLSHFVSDLSAGRATFPMSGSGDLKGRFSRYKSLIASEHIQMGLLVLVTARLFIEQSFGIVLAWV